MKSELASSIFLAVSKQIFNGVISPNDCIKIGNEFIGKNIPEKKIERNAIKIFEISPNLKIIIIDAEINPKPIKGIELNNNDSITTKISNWLIS